LIEWLLILATAAVVLLAVPTAHADAVDDNFLAELASQGITDHISSLHAIQAGHFACVKLDNGFTVTDVVTDVADSSGMSAYQCGFFVGAAINAYCPRHKDEVRALLP
jgi:hypothetical protein